MLTIITPCCRQKGIPALYNSIRFDKIHKWIILYDTSKNRKYDKMYHDNPKILEVEVNEGISGNPQRNYGITLVDDGFIYFLDDDNIMHPHFWAIVDILDNNKFYTFDQLRTKKIDILHGNNINVAHIDTAMFLVHRKQIGNIRWIENLYEADGHFITELNNNNRGSHVYINAICCYYNYLS